MVAVAPLGAPFAQRDAQPVFGVVVAPRRFHLDACDQFLLTIVYPEDHGAGKGHFIAVHATPAMRNAR